MVHNSHNFQLFLRFFYFFLCLLCPLPTSQAHIYFLRFWRLLFRLRHRVSSLHTLNLWICKKKQTLAHTTTHYADENMQVKVVQYSTHFDRFVIPYLCVRSDCHFQTNKTTITTTNRIGRILNFTTKLKVKFIMCY